MPRSKGESKSVRCYITFGHYSEMARRTTVDYICGVYQKRQGRYRHLEHARDPMITTWNNPSKTGVEGGNVEHNVPRLRFIIASF